MIRHWLLTIKYSCRKSFFYFYCLFFSLFIARQMLTYTSSWDYLLSTMNYPTNFFSVLTGLNLFLVVPYHLFSYQQLPLEITRYTRREYSKKVWFQNIGVSLLSTFVTDGFALIGLEIGKNQFTENTVRIYDSGFYSLSIFEIVLITSLILFAWLYFLNQWICLLSLKYSLSIGFLIAVGLEVAGMSLLVLPGNASEFLFRIFFLKLEGSLGMNLTLSSFGFAIGFWLVNNGILSILINRTVKTMNVLSKGKRESRSNLSLRQSIYEMKEWLFPVWIGQGISFVLILLMKGNGDYIEILDNLLQVSFRERIVSYAVYYVPILLFLYRVSDYTYRMNQESGIYIKIRKGNRVFEKELRQKLYGYATVFSVVAVLLTGLLYIVFREEFHSWVSCMKLILSLFLSMELLLTTKNQGMLIAVLTETVVIGITQWLSIWIVVMLWTVIILMNHIKVKQSETKEKEIYEMHRQSCK